MGGPGVNKKRLRIMIDFWTSFFPEKVPNVVPEGLPQIMKNHPLDAPGPLRAPLGSQGGSRGAPGELQDGPGPHFRSISPLILEDFECRLPPFSWIAVPLGEVAAAKIRGHFPLFLPLCLCVAVSLSVYCHC